MRAQNLQTMSCLIWSSQRCQKVLGVFSIISSYSISNCLGISSLSAILNRLNANDKPQQEARHFLFVSMQQYLAGLAKMAIFFGICAIDAIIVSKYRHKINTLKYDSNMVDVYYVHMSLTSESQTNNPSRSLILKYVFE